MNDDRGADVIAGAFAGFLATLPWLIAVAGWTLHWNVYFNLTLTLGGFVLWASLIVACGESSK